MKTAQKICSIEQLQKITSKKDTEHFVLCQGHYNLIHPGHLRFIQYAKSLGTKLIVAIYGESYFSDSPMPHYPQQDRALGVAMLEQVDYVFILEELSIAELVQWVAPSHFVMGKEFEQERNEEVKEAVHACESLGGKVIFHAGEIHYASTQLLHGSQSNLQLEKRTQLQRLCEKQKLDLHSLLSLLENFSKSKLLVLGDTIVDQYVACDALGMSSEAPVLVVKELEARNFVGGAAIVASHIRSLGAECHYVSVVGEDDCAGIVEEKLKEEKIQSTLLYDATRPTTFKIRYMVGNQKLFRVSRLQEHSLDQKLEEELICKMKNIIPQMHGVVFCDFVYGVITPRILKEITQIAKTHKVKLFGDLQCSSQVGDVSKFRNFDLICPTEREARIALGDQRSGLDGIANALMKRTQTQNLLLTMGAEGFISYGLNEKGEALRQHFPALEVNPLDLAGAGDSLLSAMALSLCSGASLMQASVIGTCMAALAVQTVGNLPVKIEALRRSLLSLT